MTAAHMGFRRMTPSDRKLVSDMHGRCSVTTRYRRWHAPLTDIPQTYLGNLVGGCPDHVGVVAVQADGVIALGSASQVGDGTWELGLLVEDAFQRRGVGKTLLRAVVDQIGDGRPRYLCADILFECRGLLPILQRFGPTEVTWEGTVLHVVVALAAAHGA